MPDSVLLPCLQMGMLSHMPPCLLREGRLSTAADVYAFAVMMYELFTQERAWQGLHYGQLLQQVGLHAVRTGRHI